MQHEITLPDLLLSKEGILQHKGWAKQPLLTFNKEDIKVTKFRLKEWDYYCILQKEYGFALTIADLGYAAVLAINIYDFTTNTEISDQILTTFSLGSFKLPISAETGNINIKNERIKITVTHENGNRKLSINTDSMFKKKIFNANIVLKPQNKDSMVIAIPFTEDKDAFYYNQKINCLSAEGTFTFGDNEYILKEGDATAILDWARGIWPYKTQWYWGSCSAYINNKPFGFNIGFGFGDTTAATENIMYYDGVSHKLDIVNFNFDKKDYLKPLKITSNDGRFELDFQPTLLRQSIVSFIFVNSIQKQVFGYFTGKVILDDGNVLEIKNLLGFVEDILNQW